MRALPNNTALVGGQLGDAARGGDNNRAPPLLKKRLLTAGWTHKQRSSSSTYMEQDGPDRRCTRPDEGSHTHSRCPDRRSRLGRGG